MRNGKSPRLPLAVLLLFTLLGSMLVFSPARVFAQSCGESITTSTTLSADIGPCSGDGLDIGASNIVLDCAGHTISSTSSNNFGIDLYGHTNVTVENCVVTGFHDGIRLDYSSGNTFTGNTADSNSFGGFNLFDSSSNTLTGNTADSNSYAGFIIALGSSSSNTLTGNTADSNYFGYSDATTGLGTAGTNNTYVGNECSGNSYASSPSGLCSTSPPIPALPFPFAIPVVLAATALIYLGIRRRLLGGQTAPSQ
ncbi:MAG: NosD domain-containing protein [Nitrososphaerales archaeon]